jgi:hypothetical protein
LSEFHLTVYAKIAKSKYMFQSERKSPTAAPSPAAAPAAGIASPSHEAQLPMPAAPFPEAAIDEPVAHSTRQWAIGHKQCHWIIGDEAAGADALMCGAPALSRRPFCAEHCMRAYEKPAEDEAGAEEEMPEEQEEEAE